MVFGSVVAIASVRKSEENEEERIELLRHQRMEKARVTTQIASSSSSKVKTLQDKGGMCRDKVDKKSKE